MGGTPLRMLWERCSEPISDKPRSYHLRDVPKNTIWGSFGPLGPSRGICRPNRTAKSRNKSCIGKLEHFGSAFWHLGLVKAPSTAIKLKKSKQKFFFLIKKIVFCVLLHRVPIATGTMNILCCRREAPQAHLRLTGPSNGFEIQTN